MVASLLVGGGIYALHPDPWPALAAVCTGTLVDADHLLDLWAYQKHRPPGEKLMAVFDAHTWVKSYVILHALEFLPLLAAMIFITDSPWLWAGIFCGYAVHLVMDMAGNRSFPWTYSLMYRIWHGFDANYIWWDSHLPGTAWSGKRRSPPSPS